MYENLSPIMVQWTTLKIIQNLRKSPNCSISELQKLTYLDDMDFYIAIGYLFKEEKIEFKTIEDEVFVHKVEP